MKKIIFTTVCILTLCLYNCQVNTYKFYYTQSIKNNFGVVIANIKTDYNNGVILTDNYGNILSTQRKDYVGNIIEQDNLGNIKAIYTKDYLGDIIKHNYNDPTNINVYNVLGIEVGSYYYDFFGNIIINE